MGGARITLAADGEKCRLAYNADVEVGGKSYLSATGFSQRPEEYRRFPQCRRGASWRRHPGATLTE
jgi:hypothetical protein